MAIMQPYLKEKPSGQTFFKITFYQLCVGFFSFFFFFFEPGFGGVTRDVVDVAV